MVTWRRSASLLGPRAQTYFVLAVRPHLPLLRGHPCSDRDCPRQLTTGRRNERWVPRGGQRNSGETQDCHSRSQSGVRPDYKARTSNFASTPIPGAPCRIRHESGAGLHHLRERRRHLRPRTNQRPGQAEHVCLPDCGVRYLRVAVRVELGCPPT